MSEEVLLYNIRNNNCVVEPNEYNVSGSEGLYHAFYRHYMCNLAKYWYKIEEAVKANETYNSSLYYLFTTDHSICLISEDNGKSFVGFVIYATQEKFYEEPSYIRDSSGKNSCIADFMSKSVAASEMAAPKTYIAELFVHPKHRHKGIATKVVKQILANNEGPVILEILNKNTVAKEFWARVMSDIGMEDVTSEYPTVENDCPLQVHVFAKK